MSNIHSQNLRPLSFPDYLLLIVFCVLLFGYVAVSGRPLTLHEARLPECSREMLANHDWLVPMNGSRPWLERPPFPHWVMMSVALVTGQKCDTEWSVRIAPALCGLLIVLMTAWIAGKWFGRNVGIIAGLALATMWEFYQYSTLAEDDIFLAFLVAIDFLLFVQMEFFSDPEVENRRLNPLAWRPWQVLLFFIVLGLTNLAKGPIVGAAVVVGPIIVFFLIPPIQWRRIRRYFWLWGILIAVAIGLSWHIYIAHRYPGAGGYAANLHYDFSGTKEFDEPWWYYPPTLLGVGMPWTPLAIVALFLTAGAAWRSRDRTKQFLWCWAILPIIILSIPHRKHHHYLVPSLAPWAILAAVGAAPVAKWLFKGPAWSCRPSFGLLVIGLPATVAVLVLGCVRLLSPQTGLRSQLISAAILIVLINACVWAYYHGVWTKKPAWMLAAIVIGFGGAYSWQQTHLRNDTVADTQFLRRDVEAVVPKDKLLAIDAAIGPLDFFRVQFYLRSDALLVHNLSYLRSDKIHASDVYVVASDSDLPVLRQIGTVQELSRSWRRKRKDVPTLALYHLTFWPDLKRYPPPPVSPMQAMMRQPGPWCGPPLAR